MADEKNLLSTIGLCRAAGKTVIGTDMICEAIAKKRRLVGQTESELSGVIVIEASDTSPNTHKKLTDKCEYYKAMRVRICADCEKLGRAVGKSAVAAVAIMDENLCRAIIAKLS
jgi:ribosomal protein L7Ae-like RNA K-turn-binding protein